MKGANDGKSDVESDGEDVYENERDSGGGQLALGAGLGGESWKRVGGAETATGRQRRRRQ